MSEEAVEDEEQTEDNGEEEGQRRKTSGKVIVLFIVLPLILVLAGGGAAAYFLLFSSADVAEGETAEGEGEESDISRKVVFYDLPEMLVNMNTDTNSKQKTFLKIRVALELDSEEAAKAIEAILPRVIDNFQIYLRELRLDDLKGSAGILRLKEELLYRLNTTARPIKVRDVLFKELLIQ